MTTTREAAYERAKTSYTDGSFFARRSFPDPVARYHGGPVQARQYGAIMEAVARFAGASDWHAAAARNIFGKVNLYGTATEAIAQVAAGISEFWREGYTDVIGMTGPEAGRESQYRNKPVTEGQAVELVLLLTEVEMAAAKVYTIGYVPTVGWALEQWMREPHLRRVYSDGSLVIGHYFPNVREYVASR